MPGTRMRAAVKFLAGDVRRQAAQVAGADIAGRLAKMHRHAFCKTHMFYATLQYGIGGGLTLCRFSKDDSEILYKGSSIIGIRGTKMVVFQLRLTFSCLEIRYEGIPDEVG